jgi:UDP-N-acetylmuramoyl-tripeptide--D-alanyl-D-alanine ligase
MMLFSKATAALNARLIGNDGMFARFITDTRQIQKGDLFVALRGERFDGGEFVVQAIEAGAVGAVVHAETAVKLAQDAEFCAHSAALIIVPDTRIALGQLGAYWRGQFQIPLIGLTGSNGKTTVKDMIASILRVAVGNDAVLATQGNLNNDIGMPLMLGRLNSQHRFAVIEMGMNHTGEIDYLTRLARPTVALINNASGAHLAGLGSVDAVASAKGEIFAGLVESGIAIINADDPYATKWRELAGTHTCIDFSLNGRATICGAWCAERAQLHVDTPQGRFTTTLQVLGEHNARNALAATAAAFTLNISLSDVASGLAQFSGVAGRLQRKVSPTGATLLDDTYNANPASMLAAIQVLAAAKGKRILVIGDMGELGEDAARLHAEIGFSARQAGIEQLYALGTLSEQAVQAFGMGAQYFVSATELHNTLIQQLDANTTVLVKGSRFMKMERVVQALASE